MVILSIIPQILCPAIPAGSGAIPAGSGSILAGSGAIALPFADFSDLFFVTVADDIIIYFCS